MQQYKDLVNYVLDNGTRKPNRTGIDTISAFNYNYTIDLENGFPLLTTKEMSWKNIVIENLWFLSGERDVRILRRHGIKFWEAWTDHNLKVPSAYGYHWREFISVTHGVLCKKHRDDQIRWVLNELKRNKMSRRLVVTAWHPGNAIRSKLPPCHMIWVLNVQNTPKGERLCLHLTQRSADVALGVPYNIAGYALILEIISRLSGIKAGTFAHSIVDAHIYTDNEERTKSKYDHIPNLKRQVLRFQRPLPKIEIDKSIQSLDDLYDLTFESTDSILEVIRLKDYNPHPAIEFRVAV